MKSYLSSKVKNPKSIRVLACGTFDGLHSGHLFFLKKAFSLGDQLFVIVALDQNVKKLKNKKPHDTAKKRKCDLEKLDFINKVYLGDKSNFLKSVLKIKPDILALGYDQKLPFNKKELKLEIPNIKIVRISSHKPHQYKTSLLKKDVTSL